MTITVPAATIRSVYDDMMREYTKSAKVDGFRVGHVPASILERKYSESLRVEAMGKVLEQAVEEGLKDDEAKPLAYETPALEGDPDFVLDKDFTFSVTYDVYPEVQAPSLDNIEFTVPNVVVSDEDVAKELERIRDRNAIVIEKSGPCEKGDVVTVDFHELNEIGEIVEKSERKDFAFELGSGYNIYKFDDDIIGMKVGEERTFTKEYSADFENADLAGKKLDIHVKLTKTKQKDIPPLDDELAQDVSEKYKTVDDLKKGIMAQFQESLTAKIRKTKEELVLDELRKRTVVDLPESMVIAELSMRWESLKRRAGADSDEKLDKILAYTDKTRDSLLEEWKPEAEKAIASRLIVDKLIEASGIEVTDADLDSEYATEAQASSLSVEEIKAEYEKQGSLEYLKEHIKENKFFDSVLAGATVKVGEAVSFVDFMSRNE
jgi:trigger factor